MTPTQRDLFIKIKDRANMDKFARELVKQFRENLDKTNAVGSGKLKNEIEYKLHYGSDRLVHRITLTHPTYGMFVDMGVGRGVKLQDIGYQRIGKSLLGKKIGERRAKRWYLKKIFGQTIRLAEYVQNTRGNYYTVQIKDYLDQVPDMTLHI
jgi:hypothetical protein